MTTIPGEAGFGRPLLPSPGLLVNLTDARRPSDDDHFPPAHFLSLKAIPARTGFRPRGIERAQASNTARSRHFAPCPIILRRRRPGSQLGRHTISSSSELACGESPTLEPAIRPVESLALTVGGAHPRHSSRCAYSLAHTPPSDATVTSRPALAGDGIFVGIGPSSSECSSVVSFVVVRLLVASATQVPRLQNQ